MTYESFDNILTVALTAMIYGTSLWLAIAFPLFVLRRELSFAEDQQISQADVKTKVAALPEAQPEASQQPSIRGAIVSEPVNFALWKVADLRWSKLRDSFSIPLRPQGTSRAYKKAELDALYIDAMKHSTPHLVGG